MKTLLISFIQIIAASGLLYGYYHLFLRNKKFHQYNRYFLLLATAISICIPFLHIPVYFNAGEMKPAIVQTLTVFSSHGFEENVIVENNLVHETWFTSKNILSCTYMLIAGFLFFRFIAALLRIARLVKIYPGEKINNVHFVATNEPATPFSFFRWLFWNNKIELNSDNGQQIFRHELFHIRQKHSWDIIFLELIAMIFWINPFFHLIKKEIKAIHEFLADQFAVNENQEWDYAELLLMQVLGSPNTRLTNPFFHNQIKRRIAMLTTSKQPGYQYLRKIMVLPLAAIIVGLFAFTYKNKVNNKALWSEKPITIVVDAGHGGDDSGASSPDDKYKEARLSLEMAKTIQGLAKEYNITVVMTREDEKYPGGVSGKIEAVRKIVEITNNIKPAAFISLHLSITPGKEYQSKRSGFEAYISNKREDKEGKVLASVILQNLATLYKTKAEVKIRNNTQGIYVLDQNNCPAVLLECGFINNAADIAFINDKANQEKIARSILEGIVKYKNAVNNATIDIPSSTIRPDTIKPKQSDDNKIFEKVEIEPSFPGGVKAWTKYLERNFDVTVPVQKGAPDGTYTVFIQFVVAKDGSISDVKALTKHGFGMEAEALRVIKKGPNWLPGIQNGKKVNAYRKQPVNFQVTKEKRPATSINTDDIKPNNEVVVGPSNKKTIPVEKEIVLHEKSLLEKETMVRRNTDPLKEKEVIEHPLQRIVFEKVETEPSFPGGDAAWKKYLERNLNFSIPKDKGAPGGIYSVRFLFIVNADGSLHNINPLTNFGYGMEEEVTRIIKNSPRWVPAEQNGKKVNAYRKQAVTFKVMQEKEVKETSKISGITLDWLKNVEPHTLLGIAKEVDIMSYTFEIEGPNGNILSSANKGNRHTASTMDLINKLGPGKIIIIESIIGMIDGQQIKYPSRLYRLI